MRKLRIEDGMYLAQNYAPNKGQLKFSKESYNIQRKGYGRALNSITFFRNYFRVSSCASTVSSATYFSALFPYVLPFFLRKPTA